MCSFFRFRLKQFTTATTVMNIFIITNCIFNFKWRVNAEVAPRQEGKPLSPWQTPPLRLCTSLRHLSPALVTRATSNYLPPFRGRQQVIRETYQRLKQQVGRHTPQSNRRHKHICPRSTIQHFRFRAARAASLWCRWQLSRESVARYGDNGSYLPSALDKVNVTSTEPYVPCEVTACS